MLWGILRGVRAGGVAVSSPDKMQPIDRVNRAIQWATDRLRNDSSGKLFSSDVSNIIALAALVLAEEARK